MLKPLTSLEIQIIQELEKNGIIKNDILSQKLNNSEEKIAKIRNQLESDGIILKYKAIINREKIESSEVIAIIQVNSSPQMGIGYDKVAKKICQFKEVQSCILVSGSFDILVEVSGSSIREVAFFVADKLATIKEVEGTKTSFLLKRYKQNGDIFENTNKTHRQPLVI